MGKTELITGLADTILRKSTFLQVARTATKGQIVQKGMELHGKEAIKFFDKMPNGFQKYLEAVNSENLTVRYGVKGYEGSSVTGFQVLDGENIVAKGAMGIDKTYGKRPILQMRVKLLQDSQNASINFKYDGNKAFNGNASINSTTKNGICHTQLNYGDTVNCEYGETNKFSNWLKQHGLGSFDFEIPTARQFSEHENKVHKMVREFVNGRRTTTPEQREMLKKRSRHNTEYIKEQKARIKKEMLKEIEEIKNDAKLKQISEVNIEMKQGLKSVKKQLKAKEEKVKDFEKNIREQNLLKTSFMRSRTEDLNTSHSKLLEEIETWKTGINDKIIPAMRKNQKAEKILRKNIAERIKEVRSKYKTQLSKYSSLKAFEKAEKERRLDELAEKVLSEKKISKKSLQEQFKKEKIEPYKNQEIINQIKDLKGSTIEVAEQSKNIFLKEMGFNPELVKVRYATEKENLFQSFSMAFNSLSGEITISPTLKCGNLMTSSFIRHELDHFQLFANLCKSMGTNNFKQMILTKHPKATTEMFNTEFWNKAIQNAEVLSPAEITKYTKAFKEYQLPSLFKDDDLTKIKYFGNPIETRAYDVQASISKSLGIKPNELAENVVTSRIFRQINSAIERLEQKTGKSVDKDFLERLRKTEILQDYDNEIDILKIYNNVLKKLESM